MLVGQLLSVLLTVGSCLASATAGPFSQLVVFGDSLSDIGNISQATFGAMPGPYYHSGRFSNGPVYAEALATGLELPPISRSTAGGNNFAYGGAKTSGTGGFEGLFIRDIDEQVDRFLDTRTVDPDALFVVFAGANDLLGDYMNITGPTNRLATDIGRLITAGANQLLVFNLPLLGYTPRFNSNPTNFARYNSSSEQFNAALSARLDTLEATNPAISLFRFDVAALFNEAISDPFSFGLTNVTHAAAPGLEPGDSSYNTSQIADNPNEYMFWDDLHPTAAVHAILAERVLQLFALPGDFNQDEVVDTADYVVWRKGLGSSYTQQDYGAWQASFGATAGGGNGSVLGGRSHFVAPEPGCWQSFFIIAAIATTALRMR